MSFTSFLICTIRISIRFLEKCVINDLSIMKMLLASSIKMLGLCSNEQDRFVKEKEKVDYM